MPLSQTLTVDQRLEWEVADMILDLPDSQEVTYSDIQAIAVVIARRVIERVRSA